MINQRHINRTRIIAAILFIGLALLKVAWLLLLPAIVLIYQAYQDHNCVVCEAGFCANS